MIYYEDLLCAPYKPHGRNPQEGFDCLGLLIFCAARAGKKLNDPIYGKVKFDYSNVEKYILEGYNVREVDGPAPDLLVSFNYNTYLHCGYLVDKKTVLHANPHIGVQLTPLSIMNPAGFYEVV